MAKSPKAPDPYKTASAQQGAEVGAAGAQSIIGNPNVYSPYGSQSYSIAGWEQVPGANGQMINVPRYNMTQQLSPDQQRLLGLQTQQQYNMGLTGVEQSAKLRGLLGQSVDSSGWQGWNKGPAAENLRQDQGPTDRAAIEQAMMQNYTQDTQGQHAAQDAQMAARGLMPGSAQYGGQYQQREQARGRAGREAYLASGQESRQAQDAYNQAALSRFNMGGQMADRENAMRQAQAQETFALRNQPLNEISALLAGSQVTMPQFNPYQSQGINAPNIMGAVQQQYGQQAQNANAFNSGLFQLGSAAVGGMAMSDRRLKQDIEAIEGMRLAGAPLYHFRYIANPEELQIGVMADEVRPLHPDAVVEIGGYDHVDYSLLLSRHEGD